MNDDNTYTVQFKSNELGEGATLEVETLVSFDCGKERYIDIIDKAVKNGLSFTADDGLFKTANGGRHYFVSVYLC